MAETLTPLQQAIHAALRSPSIFCERLYFGKRVCDRVPEAMSDWQARVVEIAIKPYLREGQDHG